MAPTSNNTAVTACRNPWSLFMLAARIAISSGLLWLLLRNVNVYDVVLRLADISIPYLALAFALVLIQIAVAAARWILIVKGIGRSLTLTNAFRLSLEGQFFNQALPSNVGGDAIKIMRAKPILGSTRIAIQSVVIDRVMGFFGLLLLVILAQIWVRPIVNDTFVLHLMTLTILIGLMAALTFLMLGALGTWLQRYRAVIELSELSKLASNLLVSSSAPGVMTLSLLGHILAACTFVALASAIGSDLTLANAILLIPTALLVTLLPISIAGWGLREGAVVTLLAFVGISSEVAFSLSVLFGLTLLVVSLPGGVLWILSTEVGASNTPRRENTPSHRSYRSDQVGEIGVRSQHSS